jgi:GTP cyclohydrolase IA
LPVRLRNVETFVAAKHARVGVVMEAEHTRIAMPGVRAQVCRTVTPAVHGLLGDDARTRQEFFALTGVSR